MAYSIITRGSNVSPTLRILLSFRQKEDSPLSLHRRKSKSKQGLVDRENGLPPRNNVRKIIQSVFLRIIEYPFCRPPQKVFSFDRDRLPFDRKSAEKSQDVGEARRSAATAARIASSLPYAGGLHFFFHVRSIVTGRLVAWADGRPGRGWLRVRAVMKAACLHAVDRQVCAAVCHVAFSSSFPSHIFCRNHRIHCILASRPSMRPTVAAVVVVLRAP